MRLPIPFLILVLAFGSCSKSEQPSRTTFAGTYIGTTHRWQYSGSDTGQHSYDQGTYADSVIITTWADSIRFTGIMRAHGGGVVNLAAKDTGLIRNLTVSYAMRSYETCKYTLSDTCDSLKINYVYHISGPQTQYVDDVAQFKGVLR